MINLHAQDLLLTQSTVVKIRLVFENWTDHANRFHFGQLEHALLWNHREIRKGKAICLPFCGSICSATPSLEDGAELP
jgi:hypothetical protein